MTATATGRAVTIPERYAYLAVFIGVWGHATSEFFAVLSGMSGPPVSVWRYLLGGVGLVLVTQAVPGARDLMTPLKARPWSLFWLSGIGVAAAYLAFHWALDYASVVQVATLVTVIPIFVGLANLVLNGQRIGAVKLASGAFAVAGLAVLITDGALQSLAAGSNSILGVLLAVSCSALVAVYAVKIKPIIAEYGALRITAISTMIGGLQLWVVVGLFWGLWVNPAELFERPTVAWVSILILAFWNTTITQYLWIGGLAAAPDMTRASYLFFLKPIIAAVLALAILRQPVSALQILAIVVVLGSVAVEIAWPRVTAARARRLQRQAAE